MKFTENLQKLLPLGYLFLVVIGIIKETVFYNQIGINILRYSSIMDILISPIADLTSYPIILLSLIAFVILLYLFMLLLTKNYQKEWVQKMFNLKKQMHELTPKDIQSHFGGIFILVLAGGLLSFFLGIGIGTGEKVVQRIASGNLEYKYVLTYNTNETKEVYLIGSNSANIFYIEKGNKNVCISPVGAVKKIELSGSRK